MRRLAACLLAGALVLPGTPAFAETPQTPVALIVGVRAGAAENAVAEKVAEKLDTQVDVLASAPLGGPAITVDVPADQLTEATAALRADPAVRYVETDHIAHAETITANDPAFAQQWGLARSGVAGAWASTGGAGVTVAVVDTGVSKLADFTGRVLTGYDFVNKDSNAADDNGHGTMAAGVIAAAAGNGVGIAGICYQCRILPVKVLDAKGSGSYSAIADGIRYAADHDADIINLSLSGTDDSQLLRDAVAYAVSKGALVIAAAGNTGKTTRHFPAAIASVLAVGASTDTGARYSWSNYGASWVDLAAPGCNPAQGLNGVVSQFCGTSSATPFTAGVAALLASTSPKPSATAIRAALMSSAVPIAGHWVAAESGRIDAAAALAALPFWVTGVGPGSAVGDDITLTPHVGAGSGITRVTAAFDGVTAATATSAPWTLRIDARPITGPTTITISAYAGSAEAGTATFPVVVDHAAPVVAFRSPPAVALVRGVVTVIANASDDRAVTRVELLGGTKVLATATAAPYVLRWQSAAVNRAVTLTVRAYDRAGNVTTSNRTFVVDNAGPALVMAGLTTAGTRHVRKTKYVSARASDPHGIARLVLVINGKVSQSYAGARHTFAVPTWKYGRVMTVQVRAYDKAGNLRSGPARKWYR